MSEKTALERAREAGYCPVCGYRVFEEGPPGTWDICPICFWEDEPYPLDEPDTVTGGPNKDLSVTRARENFRRFGAYREGIVEHTRAPRADDDRHPDWPVDE